MWKKGEKKKLFVLVNFLHSKTERCLLTNSQPLNWRLNTLWLLLEIMGLLQWTTRSGYYWGCWRDRNAAFPCARCVRWVWPSQQKFVSTVLVSQHWTQPHLNCLGARDLQALVWWSADSLAGVLGVFFAQTHTEKLFSKCVSDKPFCPVPSLFFSWFSLSQTDDIKT